ncbi:hypothetical protein F4804DRAFT_324066 [Jackrogersella minutella]|nr:hypothetical protein F4804DRAFT_324066 [Jackrogersella minutella]
MGPFYPNPLQPGTYAAKEADIIASIGHPPCDCHDCQTGFYASPEQYKPALSYRGKLSESNARRLVESYTKEIHENRKYLADRLKMHADLLMSRWRKRSQEKRQALLAEVAPDLEPSQWINIRYSQMEERGFIHRRELRRRRQLLAPWLSVEVLKSNPAVLYALLHYRTAYPPDNWAAFDCRQLTLSWACGWLDVDFCNKCVVMYGPRYGSLVDWEEIPAHRADILGFPRARLVLEAQAFILTTLRSIVDKVLDGVDDSLPARTNKWQELTVNAGFKRTGEVEFWSPYTNQAFSAPPILDIDYLLSLAKTRLEATGDHLWHLQCDPAYMRRHIKVQSRKSFFKIIDGTEGAAYFAWEVYEEILGHYWWRWIEMECRNVASLHRRFRDNIHPGFPLPPRYDQALGALELILVNQVIYRAQFLLDNMPYCPGFSQHWTVDRAPGMAKGSIRVERKSSNNTKEAFEEDPLDYCLSQLLGRPDEQTNFDHAMLFAFLQNHLSQCTSKEKARIDENLLKRLSDLSTCHEMLVAVRLSRPQNKARDISEVIASETDRDRQAWKKMHQSDASPRTPQIDLRRCGTKLIEDFYAKPLSGQKSLEWVRQSRASRAALESFWDSMRGIMRKYFTGYTFTGEDIDGLLQIISADKTPEYVDPVRSEEDKILADLKNNKPEPMLRRLTLDNSDAKAKREVQSPREKIKSRPEPGSVQPITAPSAPDVTPGVDSSLKTDDLIVVTGRSLNIFGFMFPETAEESTKTVNWDDFVHAICEVGFTARNNGGSAVLFENTNGGKIVFHKPHPVAKIDSVMIRTMGKRMAKWFGWSRERFVLADSSDTSHHSP